MTTLSLYDLLNVDEKASTDEIRAAWKTAIADLDPTDRRFRAFSQAAETLLDPDARAAYDARLAEERPADTDHRAAQEPASVASGEGTPDEPVPTEEESTSPDTHPRINPSSRVLVVAILLALAAVAATIWVWTMPGASGDADKYDERERAAQAALVAAEEAVAPVLSVDYRQIDADIARARPYLTEEYGEERETLMEDVVREQAQAQRLVVAAKAVASGIVRSGEDRAEILVYLDQATRKRGSEPFVLTQWVTVHMVHEDGDWLIEDLDLDIEPPPG